MTTQAVIDQLNAGSSTQAPVIEALLTSWSPADKSAVSSWITHGTKVDLTAEDVEELIEESGASAEVTATNTYGAKVDNDVKEASLLERLLYIVQNSVNTLIQPEPISVNGVNVTDLPDSTFSIDKDNAESYNFVDSMLNWFKVNKRTRVVEAAMANGNMIKMDRDGNVTLYVKGNLKHIVDGSYVLDVKGTYEHYVGGELISKVTGKVEETYQADHNTTVTGIRKEKASQIHHN